MGNYLIKHFLIKGFSLKVSLFFLLLISNQTFSVEMYQIAHSKKMGVNVLIENKNNSWCKDEIKIYLDTEKADFFQGNNAQNLIGKLMGIILSECPMVKRAEVSGYVSSPEIPIYKATTALSDNWLLQKKSLTKVVAPLAANQTNETLNVFSTKNEKLAAEVESMQTPQLNIVNSFTVNGWAPPLNNDAFVLALDAKEKVIYTLDKSCAFRFLRTYRIKPEDTDTAYLSTKEVKCLDGFIHGKGSVNVLTADGRMLREYRGYFSHGYYTGRTYSKENRVWDMPFIKRDAKNISFLLEADEFQKIYYIGYLTLFSGETWGYCAQQRMTVLTENDQLFMHAGKIKQLVDHVTQLYVKYCPTARNISFDARRGISETDSNKLLSIQYIQKQRNGEWQYRPRYVKNFVLKRVKEEKRLAERMKREQKRLWLQAKIEYNRLKASNFNQKLSYYFEIKRLDNPVNLTAMSVLTNGSVKGNIMVKIEDINGDSAEVEWPYNFMAKEVSNFITQEGWYILKGNMELVDVKDVDDYGVPKAEFIVDSAIKCMQDHCNEVNDVEEMIREKHGLPDWKANDNAMLGS